MVALVTLPIGFGAGIPACLWVFSGSGSLGKLLRYGIAGLFLIAFPGLLYSLLLWIR